ncbi:MAG: serine hydrolase [Deltaproteobacteria bacterium]|nr:serine hydrolase [Deltaproteobacteria bacterium]MBW2395185.1 serine hydrolase [Deltaproteobacteria bacterium]
MNRKLRTIGLALLLLAALVAIGSQLRTAVRVGTGMSALVTCGLAHHTGLDPEWVMAQYVGPLLGAGAETVQLRRDPGTGTTESLAPLGTQGRAIVRGGVGCTLVADEDEATLRGFEDPPHAPPLPPDLPWPNGSAPFEGPANPALVAALDDAFAEPENTPGRMRQTLAVLVAHGGRLVAERYASSVHRDSRLLSWSAAKSVTAALIGVAELEGRLDRFARAVVPEWQEASDPRGAITPDQLLRMSSGLAFDETYGAVNDVSRMLFTHPDAGAFAADMELVHEPDSAWSYSSGTSNILARILRDLFGQDLEAQVRWSRASFFDPIGMRSAVFETDASGSFIGSSLFYATGRDWARFGQLHLQDGTWNGQRILPEDWIRYVSTPTPKAPEGRYGAGWWLNAGDPADPTQRMWPTVPPEVYAARGMSGQYVVIVPSAELVIVRLGLTQSGGDELQGIEPLVRATIDAVKGAPSSDE